VSPAAARRLGSFAFPDLGQAKFDLAAHIQAMIGSLPDELGGRIVGVGIGLPRKIESWPNPAWKRPADERWANVDFESEARAVTDLPTYVQNDITAAAGAEAMFGVARNMDDFIYLFVSAESESRLALNHRIYSGRGDGGSEIERRLGNEFRIASLLDLERALHLAGLDARSIWRSPTQWTKFGRVLDEWIGECGASLARAVASIGVFIDVRAAIIGGRFPDEVRDRLTEAVRDRLDDYMAPEVAIPRIIAGEIGAFAKAVGAASLAFQPRFMADQVGLTAG
jgi:predicted NBD/HSP70 family sugar kinase